MHRPAPQDGHDPYLTTVWTLVRAAAGEGLGDDLEASWRRFLDTYRDAIGSTVRRLARGYFGGLPKPCSDELTAGVFSYLFERRVLAKASAARGRFRCFLQGVVRNYLRHAARTARRAPEALPLEELEARADSAASLRLEEDRAWARALLARALRRLLAAHPQEARAFCLCHGFDPEALEDDPGETLTFAQAAARLQTTRATVNMRVYRARQTLRGYVRYDICNATGDSTATALEQALLEPHLRELDDGTPPA